MDFLGDLGGLFSALGPFFGSLVAVLQYRGMYMQLVNHMIMKNKEPNIEYDETINTSPCSESNILHKKNPMHLR